MIDFINRNDIESFHQLYKKLEETKAKNLRYFTNSKGSFQKLVAYVYSKLMEFLDNT